MKDIQEYISESLYSAPDFVDAMIKKLKSAGVDCKVSSYSERNEISITKYVSLRWKNGTTMQRIPRVLYAGSAFDNEPVYISILDHISSDKQLKGLFDELTKKGLREATGGQNAQWGTWKFAIRNTNDANIVMKALKNNKLI